MKKNKKTWIAVIPLFLIVVFVLAGFGVWKKYRDTLMENQEEQLLLTTRILSENMSVAAREYEDNLEFLADITEEREAEDAENIYKEYISTQNSMIANLYLEDQDGKITKYVRDVEMKSSELLTQCSEKNSVYMEKDSSGKIYNVYKRDLKTGGKICLMIDAEKYYQKLISGIRIGTNGYIVVKNADGTIIMHPDKKQWGIKVIEGRMEMYPDLDYASLKQMVEGQNSGKEGISDYYSYWWTDPEQPRVRKISAYSPVKLQDSFWSVSAVIDYDDLYEPIAEGFLKMVFVFVGILLSAGALVFILWRVMKDMRRAVREIDDLKELNEQLEKMHRSEENIAHQQRLQIMGTMTGGIAHEFNNFLTPIMGYAELLMMELPEGSEEQDSAKEIYDASEKAKDVVRQISSLSRKNVETVYKNIPMKKLMTRALKMIESICTPQVHLESDIQIETESILGNATQLNQVLLNICVNAVHAIGKEQGVILVVCRKEAKSKVDPEVARKLSEVWESYIHILVKDNGCGMDKETIRHIFDPFFTTKKGGEGTGLGLALAEQIISSHKGYLYAESEKGKGSTFHIYLPMLEVEHMPQIAQNVSSKEYHIVVADDNAKVLQLLKKNFEKIGIQIRTCMKKEELQQCLREQEMDVLVVDETLEDCSGVDFCMSLAGKYPDMMKFIITDGLSREAVEAKQKGIIDGYVEKPVSDTAILEAIRNRAKDSM